MSVLLFENDFSTTLASPINNSVTSVTLLSVAGLPTIVGDEYFKLTFIDASTKLIKEIVNCTAVVGSVVTIVRGAEGTTPLSWSAGDIASGQWTAGSAAAMQQTAQAQGQTANYAAAGGSANVITAALTPALTSHVIGMPIRVKIATVNTAAVTFNPGPSAIAVIAPNGSALQAGDLPAGEIVEFKYDGASYQVQVVGANTTRPGVTRLATNAETSTGTDATIAVTPAGAASKYATLTGLGASNAAIAALQALEATGVINIPGYLEIPINGVGTVIIQWGILNFTPSGGLAYFTQAVGFGTTFPTAVLSVVATPGTTFNGGDGTTGGVIDVLIVTHPTASGFNAHIDTNASQVLSGVHTVRWMAIGY